MLYHCADVVLWSALRKISMIKRIWRILPAILSLAFSCEVRAMRQELVPQADFGTKVMPIDARAIPGDRAGWTAHVGRLTAIRERRAPRDYPLVFLGDSLTARWPRPIWNESFAPYGALNLGIGGDRTEELLWRLGHGNWGDGPNRLRPKLVVLMIGTNNLTAGRPARDIVRGVGAILDFVRRASPSSRVVLIKILPRRGDVVLQRQRVLLNRSFSIFASPRVDILDLSSAFVDAQGNPARPLYIDGLHLTEAGYRRYAELLLPEIRRRLSRIEAGRRN
jgi:lysophospholipase L1-like esterase